MHTFRRPQTRCVLAPVVPLLLVLAAGAHAQSATVTQAGRARLQQVTGPYPIQDIAFYGRDSVRIIVEDSSRTVKAIEDNRWMFGPPVTAEEAGGCPPQKVLGRRIARQMWRQQGKAMGLQEIIIRVHGASGIDRLSYVDMHYGRAELDAPWVGDRPPSHAPRR